MREHCGQTCEIARSHMATRAFPCTHALPYKRACHSHTYLPPPSCPAQRKARKSFLLLKSARSRHTFYPSYPATVWNKITFSCHVCNLKATLHLGSHPFNFLLHDGQLSKSRFQDLVFTLLEVIFMTRWRTLWYPDGCKSQQMRTAIGSNPVSHPPIPQVAQHISLLGSWKIISFLPASHLLVSATDV